MKLLKRLTARIRRDERGELEDLPGVVILIAFVAFPLMAMLFIWAQHTNATTQVQAAAFAAARDVSMSGTTDNVQERAQEAAELVLDDNVRCSSLSVTTNDNGLNTALGQTGSVSATVTCSFQYLSIKLPGFPTTATITQTANSPVDPYRERN